MIFSMHSDCQLCTLVDFNESFLPSFRSGGSVDVVLVFFPQQVHCTGKPVVQQAA